MKGQGDDLRGDAFCIGYKRRFWNRLRDLRDKGRQICRRAAAEVAEIGRGLYHLRLKYRQGKAGIGLGHVRGRFDDPWLKGWQSAAGTQRSGVWRWADYLRQQPGQMQAGWIALAGGQWLQWQHRLVGNDVRKIEILFELDSWRGNDRLAEIIRIPRE